MLRSILVPLDGSTFGEHALPLALSLARRAGATLRLAHVHQASPPATVAGLAIMDSVDLHLRQDEQAYLADVQRRAGCRPGVHVHAALLDGDVAPALRQYAVAQKADLVVLSTHGRGTLGRFWLGSVADDLMRDLPCPALLTRTHEGKPDLAREPALKSIVVPLDGTPLAEGALEQALNVGSLFEADYTLLRVVRPVVRPTYLPEGTTPQGLAHGVLEQVHTLQHQLVEEARQYLAGVAEKLRPRGVRVQMRALVEEDPAVAILLEAQGRHADLVAMATHGRRGLQRLFLGSVADKVVRGGAVPVLLYRPAH
jgi:nucleotide-binding universal stress UspA family protein